MNVFKLFERGLARSILSIVLVVTMVVSFTPVAPSRAYADLAKSTISVNAPPSEVAPGDTITLPVAISNNTGFSDYTLEASFDTDVLTLTDIARGDLCTGGLFQMYVPTKRAAFANGPNITTPSGTLYTMTFTVNADAPNGATTVSVGYGEDGCVGVEDGSDLDVVFAPGTVTVKGTEPPAPEYPEVSGGDTIEESGTYTIAARATDTITIAEGVEATLLGQGISAESYTDLGFSIGCEARVTIKDVYISLSEQSNSVAEFDGEAIFNIEGVNVIDNASAKNNVPVFHVLQGDNVTFGGTGVLYGTKAASSPYIGASMGAVEAEHMGNVTFTGGTWYLKGAKMGPIIGNGEEAGGEGAGTVTINSGTTMYLKHVGQGACIGAAKNGTASPDVIINGGQIELYVDYNGAAIGQGSGGLAITGTLTVNGGSVKTSLSSNSLTSTYGAAGPYAKPIVDWESVITPVANSYALLTLDTSAYTGNITVKVDGESFYTGAAQYASVTNEQKDPAKADVPSVAVDVQANWLVNDAANNVTAADYNNGTAAYPTKAGSSFAPDTNLYLPVSKEDHTVTIGETTVEYFWDEKSNSFTTTDPAFAWYGDGTATEYTISNASELAELAQIVNGTAGRIAKDNFAGKTITLANDIALAEDGLFTTTENVVYGAGDFAMKATQYVVNAAAPRWTAIGSGSATSNVNAAGNVFAGTFDGGGHTVSGLYMGDGTATVGNTGSVYGLFGIVSGTVKNLTVSGCITAKLVAGGVVAHLAGGTIENCTSNVNVLVDGGTTPNGNVEDGASKCGAAGGVVGNIATGSTVTGCKNAGTVVCPNTAKGGRAGGIAGLIDSGCVATLTNCSNAGTVSAYQYAGGIVGANWSASAIDGCFNAGHIVANTGGSGYAGGIAACTAGNVTNCYNTGEVSIIRLSGDKAAHFGGIVSDFSGSKVENCYNAGALTYGGACTSWSSAGAIVASGWTGKLVNCYSMVNTTSAYGLTAADLSSGMSDVQDGSAVSKTGEQAKAPSFVISLNGAGSAFNRDSDVINGGFPVLAWQGGTPYAVVSALWSGEDTVKTSYIEGETFDKGSLALTITYSDESVEIPELAVSKTGALSLADNGATVTVSYGKYSKEYVISVSPDQETLLEANVKLGATELAYSGAVQRPAVTVTNIAGDTLVAGTDYDVSYAEGCKNVGEYAVTVTGKGGYAGTVEKTFTIVAQQLSAGTVSLSETSYVYDGKAHCPSATLANAAGAKLAKGADYTVSLPSGRTNAGTYTLTFTGQGNYAGTVSKTFKITPLKLSAATIALNTNELTYNGKAQCPSASLTCKVGGATKALVKGTDYTVSLPSGRTNVGTYTLTFTGKGNYTGTASKTFTIKAQALSSSRVTLSATSLAHTGKKAVPTVAVKNAAGSTLTNGTHYTVAYYNAAGAKVASPTSVGKYTVKVTGKGNYSGIISKTFTIVPKATSVGTLTAASKGFTATWTKVTSQCDGYEVRYSRSSDMSGAGTKTVAGASTASLKVTGLKASSTYYVQVRTYKAVNGVKYYSAWSAKKTVKTK